MINTNKELSQNINEVLEVFSRIKAYPVEEMREFYETVGQALEALDTLRIEKGSAAAGKKMSEAAKNHLNG